MNDEIKNTIESKSELVILSAFSSFDNTLWAVLAGLGHISSKRLVNHPAAFSYSPEAVSTKQSRVKH